MRVRGDLVLRERRVLMMWCVKHGLQRVGVALMVVIGQARVVEGLCGLHLHAVCCPCTGREATEPQSRFEWARRANPVPPNPHTHTPVATSTSNDTAHAATGVAILVEVEASSNGRSSEIQRKPGRKFPQLSNLLFSLPLPLALEFALAVTVTRRRLLRLG